MNYDAEQGNISIAVAKEVRLHSIDLGVGRPIPQRGRPVLAEGEVAQTVLTWLQEVSRPFGTEIKIEGDTGVIRL